MSAPDNETLVRLWNDGLSARQIANQFQVSRNAVIGRIYRMRLRGVVLRRASPALRLANGNGRPRPSGKNNNPAGRNGQPRPRLIIAGGGAVIEKPEGHAPRALSKARAFDPIPGSEPVPWLERASGQCCWPVGGEGSETLSCGLSCGEATYCDAHLKLRGYPDRPKASAKDLIRALRRYAA